MCGISGLWMPDLPAPEADALLARMVGRLHHRGPDSNGRWRAPTGGPALGQARLAIIDLSEEGHQPMHSASGRYTITFNGEIYNHLELRRSLVGWLWRGHSDTESFLAAIEKWGVEDALQRTVGMFAFALWDSQTRTLTLARDRMGEKPLHVARTPRGIAFASEIKALRDVPGVDLDVDDTALGEYLRLGAVPAPRSIHRGIRKVMPATMEVFASFDASPRTTHYWLPPMARSAPVSVLGPDDVNDQEALDRLEALLAESVRAQMIADVPLGAFLSGGIDSSLVTALMQRQSSLPVRTFSIGFDSAEHDESRQAAAVAAHLGTRHTALHVTPRDALDLVPTLSDVYDEPFADASEIPTLLLARLTRAHVTVALSGDAGDELFGGYNRHVAAARLWPRLRRWPVGLRRPMAAALGAIPAGWWDAWAEHRRAGGRPSMPSALGEKIQKLAALAGARDGAEAYLASVTQWADPSALLGRDVPSPALPRCAAPSLPEAMMEWDLQGYLPDDILVKVDRAAMRHSLETRVPLLDHRVVEFALQQPLHRKIRNGRSKWMLRTLLDRHVPRALIDRPKQGFTVPLENWLRGPLREWAESLLAPSALRASGIVGVQHVRQAWNDHLRGRRNHQQRLWNLLMLQAWFSNLQRPARRIDR